MAVHHINVKKTRTHQWTYESSSGEDKAKSTIVYQDARDGWTSRCPKYSSGHPDLGSAFVLTKIRANGDEGDLVTVTLEYEATSWEASYPGRDAQEEATARYYVSVSGREEHICTAPFLSEINQDEREALMYLSNNTETNDKGELWSSKLSSMEAFLAYGLILKGAIAYKTGGIIYIERRRIKSLTELRYSAFYKQDMPPGPAGGEAKNWLYLGGSATPSDDGESWEAEFSWEWSEDGWEDTFYAPA